MEFFFILFYSYKIFHYGKCAITYSPNVPINARVSYAATDKVMINNLYKYCFVFEEVYVQRKFLREGLLDQKVNIRTCSPLYP